MRMLIGKLIDMSSIREEIKQARPFRSKGQEATVSVMRTSSDLMRYYERIVGSEDITMQQYNVLRILRGAGGPLCTMEIGERLVQRTPGITRLLDRLEKKGLIVRARGNEDRRQVYCHLTVPGLRVVERLDEPVDQADARTMNSLSEKQLDDLVATLARVRASVRILDA